MALPACSGGYIHRSGLLAQVLLQGVAEIRSAMALGTCARTWVKGLMNSILWSASEVALAPNHLRCWVGSSVGTDAVVMGVTYAHVTR